MLAMMSSVEPVFADVYSELLAEVVNRTEHLDVKYILGLLLSLATVALKLLAPIGGLNCSFPLKVKSNWSPVNSID